MSWEPADYLIAHRADMTRKVHGYVWRHLGLHMVMPPSPKGRRPPLWSLTHLGSGHRVCEINGRVAEAFPIASEIADLTDWSFDGLDGWRNRDPELAAKMRAVLEKHSRRVTVCGGGGNHDAAKAVAEART